MPHRKVLPPEIHQELEAVEELRRLVSGVLGYLGDFKGEFLPGSELDMDRHLTSRHFGKAQAAIHSLHDELSTGVRLYSVFLQNLADEED